MLVPSCIFYFLYTVIVCQAGAYFFGAVVGYELRKMHEFVCLFSTNALFGSCLAWGFVADSKYGRRPVLLVCTLANVLLNSGTCVVVVVVVVVLFFWLLLLFCCFCFFLACFEAMHEHSVWFLCEFRHGVDAACGDGAHVGKLSCREKVTRALFVVACSC